MNGGVLKRLLNEGSVVKQSTFWRISACGWRGRGSCRCYVSRTVETPACASSTYSG